MPAVDVVDETFLVVPPAALAAVFSDRANWPRFWPDLRLSVYVDRGDAGIRWTVQGALTGTMEVWLEPVLDGTLLHYFLRADPPAPFRRPKDQLAAIRSRQVAAKSVALDLKLLLEAGRAPGIAP
ncbi:polyketide cyclase / dehydrase and lipid transport [Kutzneria sp. CA-103260]|uniref:polyketide cyclase / dehydrase and lipid transport n=1 Tax=Kutzneria sp. CA-103260 TaxID=2802641 RepID=UPI001BA5BC6C|nr:polyketide cyclase / dehydrase and lipid transport [Kutzneria sp. CA-103260]QUQ67763.1 hypothetical protein JJ691_54990 [Kutzneria sp. CA-103260]